MKRAILPALVIVLAVTSAFTTTATPKSTVAIVEGYLPHNVEGTNCELKDDCSATGGSFCRVGQIPSGQRLYIMNENDECLRVGYRL